MSPGSLFGPGLPISSSRYRGDSMRHNRRFSMEQKKARWGWIFVAPSLVFFVVFSFYPIFNAIYMSFFKKICYLSGLLNLLAGQLQILVSLKTFWQSVSNTAIFTMGISSHWLFSVSCWRFHHIEDQFQKSLQMTLYSPAALSSVVAALIWLLILIPGAWQTRR